MKLRKCTSVLEDLTEILELEEDLKDRMKDYSVSHHQISRYASIDVNKRQHTSDADDEFERKTSQILTEDVVGTFENSYEECVKNSEILTKFNDLEFFLKNYNDYRFCSFCLYRKVSKKILKLKLARQDSPL